MTFPVKRRRLPSRRALLVLALLATMLGSALVGVYSGGGFTDPLTEAASSLPADTSTHAASKESLAPKPSTASNAATRTHHDPESLSEMIRRSDWEALSKLLPKGITEIQGIGGSGFQRQVKSHGFWFPVFNLAHARPLPGASKDEAAAYDPDSVSLNEVPLSITSPSPPATRAGADFSHTFTAVGGEVPYRWSIHPPIAGFKLDPHTGFYSGSSSTALTQSYTVTVTDRTGRTASALGTLIVTPAEALTIATQELPPAAIGQSYQTNVTATGGIPPYTWMGDRTELVVEPATGTLTGAPAEAGSFDITVTVTDSQQTAVSRSFVLRVTDGLEIITGNPLPPAAPGADYHLQLEASGGIPPYTWTPLSTLPPGWRLSSSGVLNGTATTREELHHLEVRVTDSAERTYRKRFQLPVRKSLIAVPSRNRVGLAWKPQEVTRALGQVAGVVIHRDGVEVYRGNGNNTVDVGLPTGASLTYTLSAILGDGSLAPFASTRVRVLPFTVQRAVHGVFGDPFADRVVHFSPLSSGGFGAAQVPANVLGPPDGRSTYSPAYQPEHLVSLHARDAAVGGSITLEFTNNIIESREGPDFTIFENVFFAGRDPNNRFMEPAVVEVALFEDEWHQFPVRVNPPPNSPPDLRQPGYYAAGFAGVNATTGDDPTDPARSGGDSFDLSQIAHAALTWIRFIRIRSTGHNAMLDSQGFPIHHTSENNALSGGGSSGFDLDAVSAVNF